MPLCLKPETGVHVTKINLIVSQKTSEARDFKFGTVLRLDNASETGV